MADERPIIDGPDKRLIILIYVVKMVLMTAFACIFIYVLAQRLAPELKELWVSLLSITISQLFGEVVKKKTQHINLLNSGLDDVDSANIPLKRSVKRKLVFDGNGSL